MISLCDQSRSRRCWSCLKRDYGQDGKHGFEVVDVFFWCREANKAGCRAIAITLGPTVLSARRDEMIACLVCLPPLIQQLTVLWVVAAPPAPGTRLSTESSPIVVPGYPAQDPRHLALLLCLHCLTPKAHPLCI